MNNAAVSLSSRFTLSQGNAEAVADDVEKQSII